MTHIPVLTNEVLAYLDPKPNENMVDGTIGQGGHAKEILEKNKPNGILLGIDLDTSQIENSREHLRNFRERVLLVHDSYAHIKDNIERLRLGLINGILLDLGYSSWQLETSQKGFSFMKDEVLDMRYNLQNTLTAGAIVNEYPEKEIETILQEYGEEKFARQIARKISQQRKIKRIESTFELKNIIEKAIPGKFHHGRLHYATKSFQALRIAVNNELGNLEAFLPDAVSVLAPGGRLVILSFHSLEDRIVKNFFKEKAKEGIVNILTRKPVVASQEEIASNPRARSAKLRAITKI